MGTPPQAPPPGVEALQGEHRRRPWRRRCASAWKCSSAAKTCNACHGVMDPLGFALENFDAIGAWRAKDRETATTIDAGEHHAMA